MPRPPHMTYRRHAERVLTVRRYDDPEVFEVRDDHELVFGRDMRCDIVLPAEGGGLSRYAGVLWRVEDDFWIRNLSSAHELGIAVPGEPGISLLRVRSDDAGDAGEARAVPVDGMTPSG